jgi:hypothetical protein
MALDNKTGADKGPLGLKAVPSKYVSLGNLIDPTKPSNMDLLVKTFGDQGITGFLELTGATKSVATADEAQWWEEGRIHRYMRGDLAAQATAGNAAVFTIDQIDGVAVTAAADGANEANNYVRLNDIILLANGRRFIVTAYTTDDTYQISLLPLDKQTVSAVNDIQANVIGNLYAQGTSQPTQFYQTQITKRTNPLFITKETFHVTGSAATNIGWVDIGNGDYRWFVKGEMDTRKRFLNQREAMLMYNQLSARTTGTQLTTGGIVGSEGYFSAIENRGIVADGDESLFGAGGMSDIDGIILAIDKEGGAPEYAMYVDLATSLAVDNMVAGGANSGTLTSNGVMGQYGAFNNKPEMAIQLGFKSFTRGGYTIHKHDWKLLNDPTLGGVFANTTTAGAVVGAMLPLANVADPKTGDRSPALEMVYKSAGGYSRDVEHWVTGGGVLGYNTDGDDLAKFNYRSEVALVTRAANQHVLLKK